MTTHGNGTGKAILMALGIYLAIGRNRFKNIFVEKKLSIVKVGSQHMVVHQYALRIYGNQPFSKEEERGFYFYGFSTCICDGAMGSTRNLPFFGCFQDFRADFDLIFAYRGKSPPTQKLTFEISQRCEEIFN